MKLLALAALLWLQVYPPPFPREGVTKVLENDRVVVWLIQWTQGRPTPMHEHAMDTVAVFLQGGRARMTPRDGGVVTRETNDGDVLFQPRGVIHVEESLTDGSRTIAIELKDSMIPVRPPNTSAPEGFPREGARLVLENARVAIWDYAWLPGRPVGLHIHNRDTVAVALTAGELNVQFRNGETRITRLVPGEAMYFSGSDAHREEVRTGSPRAIAVELK